MKSTTLLLYFLPSLILCNDIVIEDQHVEKYRNHRLLGTCNFSDFTFRDNVSWGVRAKVQQAVHRPTGLSVAIKSFPVGYNLSNTPMKVLSELEVLGAVGKHEALMEFYCGMVHEGQLYLVSEWIEGNDLEKTYYSKRLSKREVATLAKQLINAVKYLHDRGIVHADIQPRNIIVCDPDAFKIKLLDFGAAFIGKLDAYDGYVRDPHFIAPEVFLAGIDGHTYTRAVDYFPIGVFVFIVAYGFIPFYTDKATHTNVREVNYPIFLNFWTRFPIDYADKNADYDMFDFISILTQVDPEARWMSANDKQNELLSHPFLLGESNLAS